MNPSWKFIFSIPFLLLVLAFTSNIDRPADITWQRSEVVGLGCSIGGIALLTIVEKACSRKGGAA